MRAHRTPDPPETHASGVLGRDRELAAIRKLVEGATHGRSGLLVLRGEAGIGKSTLLDTAAAEASGVRVRTLRARGVEFEAELTFAGLHELLRPLLADLDRLPPPQASALRAALAIDAPREVDRFAVYTATLSLVALAAEAATLLVLVDDAQWLDEASAGALAFVARRLHAEPVAMLIALREGATGPFAGGVFPELPLPGLSGADAAVLAGRRLGRPVARTVGEQLTAVTGGNPLALAELAGALGWERLDAATTSGEPLPPGPTVREAFERRLSGLSHQARTATLVAAAAQGDDLDPVLRAAAALGATAEAFVEAETAGVVAFEDGRIRFRHPLLRSVAYALAEPSQRRAAHAVLADALAGDDRDDLRAWHLAAAAVGPDEDLARELALTAQRATRRSGHLAAARALERAARLTPAGDGRVRRLIDAAEAARRAGRFAWARELLEEAEPLAAEPFRGELEFALAILEAWSGSASEARRRYAAVARRVGSADPDRAALALGHAAAASLVACDFGAALDDARAAQRIDEAGGVGERTRTIVEETLGNALLLCGETESGTALVERSVAWFERSGELAGRQYAAACLGWLEQYDRARDLIAPTIAAARRSGDLRTLTSTLEVQAEIDFRAGRWHTAYAQAAESARLAEDTGQAVQHAYSLGVLALIEAGLGHADCEDHAQRAKEAASRHGLAAIHDYAQAALGLLELGRGRPDAAAEQLVAVADRARRSGLQEPTVVPWAGDLIDALVFAGRIDAAEAALERLEAQARMTDRAWAHAVGARCRGMLAGDQDYDEQFAEALRRHERTAAPFERARVELCWGQRMRRDRRRTEARERLRSAMDAFERLGAAPWLAIAGRELGASGQTARSRDAASIDDLTAQELQVALIVSQGASNKEAAAQLFLSTKTIESHLSSVYRKVGVRSRVQLAQRLAPAAIAG